MASGMRSVRTAEGIAFQTAESLERAGVLASFTERTGGVSEGPFRSLNLGLRAGDVPWRAAENRRRVATSLGIDEFASVRQVHGTTILAAGTSPGGRRPRDQTTPLGDADGIVTDVAGIAVAVLAADCVPIAMAAAASPRLVVIHVGWRGLAGGILDHSVSLFDRPAGVLVAIGPSIGPDHYEVGADVVEAVAAGTDGEAVTVERRRGSRSHLDLAGTAERRLRRLGVAHVERAVGCTACLEDRFFSHRRDGTTGRQALIAVRPP